MRVKKRNHMNRRELLSAGAGVVLAPLMKLAPAEKLKGLTHLRAGDDGWMDHAVFIDHVFIDHAFEVDLVEGWVDVYAQEMRQGTRHPVLAMRYPPRAMDSVTWFIVLYRMHSNSLRLVERGTEEYRLRETNMARCIITNEHKLEWCENEHETVWRVVR